MSALFLVCMLCSKCCSWFMRLNFYHGCDTLSIQETKGLTQRSQLVCGYVTHSRSHDLDTSLGGPPSYPSFALDPSFYFPGLSFLFSELPNPPRDSQISLEAKIADEAKKFLWLITISSRIILLKVNSPSGFLFSQSKTPEWALWLMLAGFHEARLLALSKMNTICFFYF